jgi:hypothetical protein
LIKMQKTSAVASEKDTLINSVKAKLTPAHAKELRSKPLAVVREVVKALAGSAPITHSTARQAAVPAPRDIQVEGKIARQLGHDPKAVAAEAAPDTATRSSSALPSCRVGR